VAGDKSYPHPIEMIQASDALKKQLAAEKGISLVIVPCWWDGTRDR